MACLLGLGALLASCVSLSVRNEQAEDPSTEAAVLARLGSDSHLGVRSRVAANPGTDLAILALLARDGEPYVRSRVAGNRNTPPETLQALSRDLDAKVRGAVAYNPAVPVHVLAELATDSELCVRQWVVNNREATPEILAKLSHADDQLSGDIAAHPKASPETLTLLSRDRRQAVRSKVAENPNASPALLTALAADPSKWAWNVNLSIVDNPNTPAEAFRTMAATDSRTLLRKLATCERAPAEVRESAAAKVAALDRAERQEKASAAGQGQGGDTGAAPAQPQQSRPRVNYAPPLLSVSNVNSAMRPLRLNSQMRPDDGLRDLAKRISESGTHELWINVDIGYHRNAAGNLETGAMNAFFVVPNSMFAQMLESGPWVHLFGEDTGAKAGGTVTIFTFVIGEKHEFEFQGAPVFRITKAVSSSEP